MKNIELESVKEIIENLLIEFDEYGFCPTITMPNAEEFAKKWKESLIFAINKLQINIDELKQ